MSEELVVPLAPGVVLGGRYELLGVLGHGGTGVVYDAQRLDDGRRVALKVIHRHLVGDDQVRGRFAREVAILRRLQGKHLCGLLDCGQADDPRGTDGPTLLYLALPKVEGPALDELLDEGPLPIKRVAEIMRQVCDGLGEAHAQGVIHRDLKPANVLLRGGKHVVVVDFGLAKIVTGGGAGTTALTAHNMLFGTPEYMAPEQARGDELDARCDIYAAGVMLYQLLTGSVPFTGTTPLMILTAHLTEEPQPPRQRAPARNISPALEAVALHALAKEQEHRYATAAALRGAVARALAAPEDVAGAAPQTVDAHAMTIPSGVPSAMLVPDKPDVGGTTLHVPKPSTSRVPTALLWVAAAVLSVLAGAYLSGKT